MCTTAVIIIIIIIIITIMIIVINDTTTLSCRIGRRAVNKDQAESEKYATGTNSTPPKVPEDNHAEDAFHRGLLSIKTTDPSKLIIIVIYNNRTKKLQRNRAILEKECNQGQPEKTEEGGFPRVIILFKALLFAITVRMMMTLIIIIIIMMMIITIMR